MRFVACGQCSHGYQIGGDAQEVDQLLKSWSDFPCIQPMCLGRMKRIRPVDAQSLKMEELPLNSFFRAVNGFGLSKGAPASAKRFHDLLTTQRVVGMKIEPVGQPERVIVRHLILEDGTRLHFEHSARGACCYFIEEPTPSCVETFDAEHSNDTEDFGSVSSEDREESGRAAEALSNAEAWGVSTEPSPAAERPDTEPVPDVPATSAVHNERATRDVYRDPGVQVQTDRNPITS